jgi:hypothetical protein
MKRLVAALILALPTVAFAQVATSRADTASQASAANQGVNVTSNAYGAKPDWFSMNLGTTASAAGANSSAFTTFNCGGIGGDSTTIGPFAHADAKMMVEADCPHVRTASLTMQIAHDVRPTDPALAEKVTKAALCMLAATADGQALRDQGVCALVTPIAAAPVQRDDARASLDNLYSGG